jgi:hypothetical protein
MRDGGAAGHLISAADLSAESALREDRLLAACTLWLRAGAVHEVSSQRALLEALAPTPGVITCEDSWPTLHRLDDGRANGRRAAPS